MPFANWFLPHKETHKKAHLISWNALVIYILIFILLQVSFSIVSLTKPGVLGISGDIDTKQVIEMTNKEREKQGLPSVRENEALDKAARLKAENMFAENYWSHFAPSGKTPWDFILGSGYKFTYAGENLAKNFYNSKDVVDAWMASPTHRENLLNSKYEDIGVAVVDGVLNGQKTTIVVQEFGTTRMLASQPAVRVSGNEINLKKSDYEGKPSLVAAVTASSLQPRVTLDPYQFSKYASIGIISLVISLLLIDMFVLYRRRIFRLSSHHIAHMSFLSVAAATIISSTPGNIL